MVSNSYNRGMAKASSKISKCMYIDMSNIYGGIAEIFEAGVYIDFATLMPFLDEKFEGIDQFKVYGSYRGYAENDPVGKKQMIRGSNEFLNTAKLSGVHFGRGKISKYGQEKGVDMQLGVDMVNDAHNGTYTDFILFSGDADFQYPISIVKGLKKDFHYCGFANRFAINFAFEAWRKIVVDYNGLFKQNYSEARLPDKLEVHDIYKDSSVKMKSIKT